MALLATRGEYVTCERVSSEPCQCTTFTDSDGNLVLIDIGNYFSYPYVKLLRQTTHLVSYDTCMATVPSYGGLLSSWRVVCVCDVEWRCA